MRRLRLTAGLSALLLMWMSVIHAAFACSVGAGEHPPPPPCHAGAEEAPLPDADPVCCQQPATLAAALDTGRPEHALSPVLWLLATSLDAALESRSGKHPSGFDPPLGGQPSPDPRAHRLRTLNL